LKYEWNPTLEQILKPPEPRCGSKASKSSKLSTTGSKESKASKSCQCPYYGKSCSKASKSSKGCHDYYSEHPWDNNEHSIDVDEYKADEPIFSSLHRRSPSSDGHSGFDTEESSDFGLVMGTDSTESEQQIEELKEPTEELTKKPTKEPTEKAQISETDEGSRESRDGSFWTNSN